MPVSSVITSGYSSNSTTTPSSFGRITNETNTSSPTTPPSSPPANIAPNKPPRSTSVNSSPKSDNQEPDEWGRKLYGIQSNNQLKR